MSTALKSDRLRAALDAYSVVAAECQLLDRTFTNGDHSRAMQAALDAADAVKSSGQQVLAEESILVSGDEVQDAIRSLNADQRSALHGMNKLAPKYNDGVVPLGRHVSGATASALYRRGLVAMRSKPLVGYVLTPLGRAVLDALTEPTPEPERPQGTPVGDTPQGALTINPLGAPLLGLTESRVREAGASALRLSPKQQQALLQILDAVGGPVGGDAGLIVPFNVVHHGTRRALVTFGMLRERVDGVQFTDFGLAAAQYLREKQS